MAEQFGPALGGISVALGRERFDVRCDQTLSDLATGKYLVTSKLDRAKFASTEAIVRSGVTTTAVLEVKPPGTIKGTVLAFPGDAPLSGFECDAGVRETSEAATRGDPGATTSSDGKFELTVSAGKVLVTCEDPQNLFADGVADVDLTATTTVTVRMVRIPSNAVDLRVELEATSAGARLTKVSALAGNAGLKVGDLVLAANGIPLAGLGKRSMQALSFFVPAKNAVTWSIERDGKTVPITFRPN